MSTREEFAVHLLNDTGIAKASELAEAFSALLTRLDTLIPVGRERCLIVTKLQEASFFAKRAIAIEPSNQKRCPG